MPVVRGAADEGKLEVCRTTKAGWKPALQSAFPLHEPWSFVYQKEARCDPRQPDDRRRGDNGDQVALDAEHRLVLESVPGKRSRKRVREVVQSARRRMAGRVPRLITSDEYKPYRGEILAAWGMPEAVVHTGWPGRPRRPQVA